jgi:hypothetical protein
VNIQETWSYNRVRNLVYGAHCARGGIIRGLTDVGVGPGRMLFGATAADRRDGQRRWRGL